MPIKVNATRESSMWTPWLCCCHLHLVWLCLHQSAHRRKEPIFSEILPSPGLWQATPLPSLVCFLYLRSRKCHTQMIEDGSGQEIRDDTLPRMTKVPWTLVVTPLMFMCWSQSAHGGSAAGSVISRVRADFLSNCVYFCVSIRCLLSILEEAGRGEL